MENTRKLRLRIEKMEAELACLRKQLEGPVWKGHTSNGVYLISEMERDHLVNALRCCVRADQRYTFDAERQTAFAHMILEAQRRGIDRNSWLKG